MSSLFGSLDTTKLDKADVVDPSTATEDGKAADAKSTYEELTRISGMASDAKELAESKADQFALEAHVASTNNPHSVTAEQVNAYTKETVDAKLDEKADIVGGKIPASQLPSYVDDVLEYDTMSAFPATGEGGKIYVAKDTNLTYRWSGTQYVEISPLPLLDDTVTEKSPNGVKSSGIWSWVKSLLPKWLTSNYAEPATVASVKVKADKATTLAGYGITDAVPFVDDVNGEKTAVTIGSRKDAQDGGSVGYSSLANGINVNASGVSSHAEGQDTSSPGFCSHSEGFQTTATGDFSHTEGWGTGTNGKGSHAEGDNTFAFADYSHVEGRLAQTPKGHDHAYVWNGVDTRPELYTSHDKGTFNINPVGGINGFWIGEQTLDAILDAILENKADKATTLAGYGITDAVPFVKDWNNGKTAVTIGVRKDGELVGEYSFANGGNVTASGYRSHAEGGNTTASADNSHSEGSYTTASNTDSHAEGNSTTASGPGSHAEGISTTASGIGSHAAGIISETREEDKYAFAWNGDDTRISTGIPYPSHGPGTFNINPVGGLNGFWIGQKTFPQAVNAALAPEYSPTSAYAVGAIVYHDGSIYQCKTAIAEGGEAWNTEHWELRELEDFFTESNSLLTGTIATKSIPAFSSSSTYEVGEIVIYDGVAYKCVTAITTAEEWTAAHWTLATNSDIAARLKGLKSDGTATDAFATDLLGKQVAKDAIDAEIIEKGTAPDAHLEAPTDEHLKLILADNSVAYDSAKALPYKLTSVIGDRVIATMTLTAASTDITLPTIAANDTTVKDFILDVTNAYAVEGVATDAGINIPRTDFKLVTRDGESLTDVTTVKAGKSAFICFTQKSPVVVDGTTYPCWCVIQLPFGDPS